MGGRRYLRVLAAAMLLAGCGGKSPRGHVPDDAEPVSARREGIIHFIAPTRGTVYVFDCDDGKVVYTASLSPRDELVVHPKKRVVALNRNVIPLRQMAPDHAHRLYFQQFRGLRG